MQNNNPVFQDSDLQEFRFFFFCYMWLWWQWWAEVNFEKVNF